MTFAYTALEANGRKKTGFVDAPDKEAAIARILAEGRYVVEIKEEDSAVAAATAKANLSNKKVPRSELALFTRRLADLSAAGLPLDRVLNIIAEQSESPVLGQIAEETLAEVRGGLSVSQALAKHPRVFNEVYTQTIRSGEASGQFPETAGRLADFLEKEAARRSQISSALVYPALLTMTAVLVITFMLTFVVPRLKSVFDGLGNDLPITTKMLLGFTTFLTSNAMMIIIGTVAAVVGYRVWAATEQGALIRDTLLLKMPVVGKVWSKAVISRYARVLGTLVFGGVPILEALSIAGMSAGNRLFKVTSDSVVAEVREGRSIAEAMRDSGTFPPVLTHMVAIGEETGDLPKMLGRVSDSLDFEVDTGMRRLTSMVEPVIVLVMGGFVAFVVISVLIPIFQAQDLVK